MNSLGEMDPVAREDRVIRVITTLPSNARQQCCKWCTRVSANCLSWALSDKWLLANIGGSPLSLPPAARLSWTSTISWAGTALLWITTITAARLRIERGAAQKHGQKRKRRNCVTSSGPPPPHRAPAAPWMKTEYGVRWTPLFCGTTWNGDERDGWRTFPVADVDDNDWECMVLHK